jgi:hypothetical protein
VVQQGPSKAEYNVQMDMQRKAQETIQQQNSALVQQLQEQASAIAAETAKRQAELAAPPPSQQTVTNANPYVTTTTQGTAGAAMEKVTTPAEPRKKKTASLQINSADISLPGVGINIGVG